MILLLFIPFALLILYITNTLTDALCMHKEIPDEKQPQVFQTINVLITILLISSFIEMTFT